MVLLYLGGSRGGGTMYIYTWEEVVYLNLEGGGGGGTSLPGR